MSRSRDVPSARSAADSGTSTLRAALGAVGVASVALAGVELAVDSAARASSAVPIAQRGFGFPAWMAGPLHHVGDTRLTAQGYGVLVLVMCVGYVLAITNHRSLRVVPVLAVIVFLHLTFMSAPPLALTDLTNYVAYARLGALHGLSPYLHTPAAVPVDASFPWATWRHYRSPYGPLFTLLTYAFAPLGMVWTFWGLKMVVALAAGGCLALVWRCAKLLERPPLGAVVFVGLNPAWLIWAVGGGHNDTLMELLVLAALLLTLTRRHALAGGAAVASAAVKVPALLILPFLALAVPSRRRLLAGAAVAAALVGLATLVAFGSLDPLAAFHRQANFISRRSVLGQLAPLFGSSALSPHGADPRYGGAGRRRCRLLSVGAADRQVARGLRVGHDRHGRCTPMGVPLVRRLAAARSRARAALGDSRGSHGTRAGAALGLHAACHGLRLDRHRQVACVPRGPRARAWCGRDPLGADRTDPQRVTVSAPAIPGCSVQT